MCRNKNRSLRDTRYVALCSVLSCDRMYEF
jgi:hypothetical protein